MANFLGILGRGSQASTDRPNRFISDDKRGELISFAALQRTTDLRFNSIQCLTRLTLLFGLPDANDGDHLEFDDSSNFGCHKFVCLTEILATFAMTADHVLNSELAQKGCRDFAGVRALFFGVTILGAEHHRQLVTFENCLNTPNIGERRMHRNVHFFEIFFGQKIRQLLHEMNRLIVIHIHFPVATHQRST